MDCIYIAHFSEPMAVQSALQYCLTITRSFTHSHTDGGVDHARRQPARREQSGLAANPLYHLSYCRPFYTVLCYGYDLLSPPTLRSFYSLLIKGVGFSALCLLTRYTTPGGGNGCHGVLLMYPYLTSFLEGMGRSGRARQLFSKRSHDLHSHVGR